MTDFQEVYKDDNRRKLRFKHGKHEYEVIFDFWVDQSEEIPEPAISFSITSDPNSDWRKQGLTQTFSVNEFAQFLNKIKEISTYDDKE